MRFDEDLKEAIDNIKNDRAAIHNVLTDAMIYLKKNDEHHKTTGMVVAKYFESLQRSNEQLIRILTIVEKRERYDEDDFTSEEVYDAIDPYKGNKKSE
jgi:hypothetical protein